jgi:hypothetical protein
MAQPSAVRVLAPASVAEPQTEVRDLLFKADRPRPIDRYIDFFGDGLVVDDGAADGCGELFLESLA